jgi:orotate phosphoribosyltransferase
MQDFQREFIDFLVSCGVLRFGDFVTKSGRRTPYFVDTGRYRTGQDIDRLAGFYARAIVARCDLAFDVLFGPAYKGIPLAVATALVLWRDHGRKVGFCFNRKEPKDHGEGGLLVGHDLRDGDRVLLIEDVTTAGTSIRETVPLLNARAQIELAGLIVSVDRMERGRGDESALRELAQEFHMPAFAIVDLDAIVEYLGATRRVGDMPVDPDLLERIRAYRAQYGPRARVAGSGSDPSR